MKASLFVRMFLGYAAVILFFALAVAVVAPRPMRSHYVQEQAGHLKRLAAVLEAPIIDYLGGRGTGPVEDYVRDIGRKAAARITVIQPDGAVLADSETEPRDLENHLYRPEISAALQGHEQTSVRYSSTLGKTMMYMSVPLASGGRVVGVLRLSLFMDDLDSLFGRLRSDLLAVIAVVTLLALAAAFFLARSVSRPMREFIDATARVAAGDLETKVPLRQHGEFGRCAVSFNAMTQNLQTMFREVRLQGEELDGILASVRDGLCLLDGEDRIVMGNEEFRRVAHDAQPEGKYFWEAVRSSELVELVKSARATGRSVVREIGLGGRMVSASVSPLPSGRRAVIILRETA
jgi:two-component system phosphate regulon sensor histidine kinase PhoR